MRSGKELDDIQRRLESRLTKNERTGCLEWNGYRMPKGYGSFRVGGRHGRTELAHRLAWELARGPMMPGLCVMHTCDNPRCCNPGHLKAGTLATNNADMKAKGRANRMRTVWGETHGRAKITSEDVANIRGSEERGIDLAARYGLSKSTISAIQRRRIWKHL